MFFTNGWKLSIMTVYEYLSKDVTQVTPSTGSPLQFLLLRMDGVNFSM